MCLTTCLHYFKLVQDGESRDTDRQLIHFALQGSSFDTCSTAELG